MIENLLLAPISVVEVFKGNYLVSSCVRENTLYELHVVTNKDYSLSLLVDDTWTFDINGRTIECATQKVAYYLMHPDIEIQDKFLSIDDPDFLYYLPFNKIDKHFLKMDELCGRNIPQEVKTLLDVPVVSTVKHSDKTQPVLSVVTTVFNNAKLLEQTIQSVINQNNLEVEFVVKDACSKDNFKEIVNKYRNYIDVLISEPDKGIYYGMDQAFRVAHGKYIQVINSDDMQTAIANREYVDFLKNNELDFVGGGLYGHRGNKVTYGEAYHVINHAARTCHATMAVKKSVYERFGGFNTVDYRCAADRDLLMRMLKSKCTHTTLNVPVAHFREEGFSSQRHFSHIKEQWLIISRYYPYDLIAYIYLGIDTLKTIIKKTLNLH